MITFALSHCSSPIRNNLPSRIEHVERERVALEQRVWEYAVIGERPCVALLPALIILTQLWLSYGISILKYFHLHILSNPEDGLVMCSLKVDSTISRHFWAVLA